MTLVFVIAGVSMLLVSGVGVTRGGRIHPAHRVRLILGVLVTGLFLVEAGLVLWSLPIMLDILGFTDLAVLCRRMLGGLAPGGVVGGVTAGLASLWVGGAAVKGGWGVSRAQRDLRIESFHAPRETHESFDLFVIPSSKPMAYTVGGRRPQVVLSSAVADGFTPELVRVITAHESVHARHRHHRFLATATAIQAAVGWLPPVLRAVKMVRLSLERWADEDASLVAPRGRADVKNALLAVCMGHPTPGVVGFGSPDMVSERISALEKPAPSAFSTGLAYAYIAVGGGALLAWASVGWATRMSVIAVINAGQCLV